MSHRIPPPDLRRQGAEQLLYLVRDLLEKHLHGHYDTLDKRNFLRDLADGFTDGGYQILTDQIRAVVGLQPVGLHGWTMEELAQWELRRLDLLKEALKVPMVFPYDGPIEMSPGHITFAPQSGEIKPDPEHPDGTYDPLGR